MAAPPLSKFLPDGTNLPTSGAVAVRIERGADGKLRAIGRDSWGWVFSGDVVEAVIEGKRGWSLVLNQGPAPEALRLPGDDDPPGERPKPRGLAPKVLA